MLLRLDSVVAGYGAGEVLRGLDLDVAEGGVTCLIGPNGAGKSTLLRTVSGLLRPSRGRVLFRGDDLGRRGPRERLLLGIVHVPQERSLFPAMTVRDNLLMGGYLLRDQRLLRERIDRAVAAFPICARRAGAHAGTLSGGEQKQVELARTLLLDPALVLLDEPSIGLDPRSRRQVFDSVRQLAGAGRTILLVEQNARSGLAAADTGAVLDGGVVRLVAPAARLLDDPEVARLYLGARTAERTHDE
ncbi:ATP-binding cassette domain-containing protein [Actinoplanes sp. KI2]|uniref:ABC transporter ATP-binding protein n=1 Tax=Actinoplanes sp. KI2 TaxID=2983315 RepID=UPI0021D574AC|nr:ATP-binding cassette domain-containing protein [Actinoplanes sp. KI2]MCU7725189.1 ATP-binding cassette domain-containing protein [Actinoplanes sp. KI2]